MSDFQSFGSDGMTRVIKKMAKEQKKLFKHEKMPDNQTDHEAD